MVLLSSGKVIPGAQIATQCQERYFYGEDQVIEKAFAQDENQIAPILSDLSVERLRSMTVEDLGKLIGFTYFQQARTRGSAEGLNATTTALAQEVMRATAAVNGDDITEDEIQGLMVGYERAQDHALMMAVKMWPIFNDLAAKFIVTDRTPGFLIGDHPVVFNNQYIEHKENLKYLLGIRALAAEGLQGISFLCRRR
ncbi:MAG: DUF4238 domain-containing protein [Polyangiaceae bacterium]|nr:DUF4238 domain-containing protein [Polyangiaceae bacterium]